MSHSNCLAESVARLASLKQDNAVLETSGSVLNVKQRKLSDYPNIRRTSKYLERQFRAVGHLTSLSSVSANRELKRRIYVLLKMSSSLSIIAAIMVLSKAGSRGLGRDYSQEPITKSTFDRIRKEVQWRLFGGRECSPSKRVWIPKSDREYRGISIPTHLDKITQQMIRLILEITNQVTQRENSIGFRIRNNRDLGLSQFLRKLRNKYLTQPGYRLLDMDIRKWFDSIPHETLRGIISKQPLPPSVKSYLYSTLVAPIRDGKGHPLGESLVGEHVPSKGTPQGGVLSPLWSNLAATPVDDYLVSRGLPFVRYADNLVVGTPAHWGVQDKKELQSRIEEVLPSGVGLHPKKERWSNCLTTLGYYINTKGEGLYQSYHKYCEDEDEITQKKGEVVRETGWARLKDKTGWYKGLKTFRPEGRLSLSRLCQGLILWNPWELLNRDWMSPITYETEVLKGGGQTSGDDGKNSLPFLHDFTLFIQNHRGGGVWNKQLRVKSPQERLYQHLLYCSLKKSEERYREFSKALS
jgi:retron-type reverse transcriptase